MSGRQRHSSGPPVAAPSGRAALRRNDQQSASRGSSLRGLNGLVGTTHHHRDESIDTRRFNLNPNLAGRSTSTILTAGLDGSTDDTELHQFSVKQQMYSLLNTNKSASNPNSLTATEVKSIYTNLYDSREGIIALVSEENRAVLRRELEAALMPNARSKPGKYEYVLKLVNIWMVMKEMMGDGINTVISQRRSRLSAENVHLTMYVECMERFEGIAAESVEATRQKAMSIKSERMPPGELERRWKDPGIELDPKQFPCCPNPNCTHTFHDAPPSNEEVDELNKADVEAHVALCREVTAFLQGNGPQPDDPVTGEPLTKHPKAPTPRVSYYRCHCHQMKANPRTGDLCPVACKYKGITYPVGSCPICKCNCKLFIKKKDYLPMIIANSQPPSRSSNDVRADAALYLNNSLSVNRIQQEASASFYHNQVSTGRLAANSNIASHIRNQGHLAGALHMVANRPNHDVLQHLRRQVESVRHPSGPTFTNVGDMRTYGRRNAADDRVRNNGLEMGGLVEGMDEDEQLKIAMIRSTTTASEEVATRETEIAQLESIIEESKGNKVRFAYV